MMRLLPRCPALWTGHRVRSGDARARMGPRCLLPLAGISLLALSGAACLLERATREPEAVTIQPLTEIERGQEDGLLWSETGGTEGFPTPVPGDGDTPPGDG